MSPRRLIRALILVSCALPQALAPTLVRADVIGAERFLAAVDRRAALNRIDSVLARGDVQRELTRLGVAPEEAMERVAALNDQELMLLADNLETLPAGGSLLGTIGVVFVVLLILEFVGVIDIFNRI